MGTGVGEAALLQAIGVGAATGAATSALSGSDPLRGAMFGALGGAIMPGIGSSLGGQAAGTQAVTSAGAQAANTAAAAAQQGVLEAGGSQIAADNAFRQAYMDKLPSAVTTPQTGFMDMFKSTSGGPDFGSRIGNYITQNPNQAAMLGGYALNAMGNPVKVPGPPGYDGPLRKFEYDPFYYTAAFAKGGIAGTEKSMYPQSQIDRTQYAVPSQMPTSAEVIASDYEPRVNPYTGEAMASGGITALPVSQKYAKGGDLGGYSDGGRLLKGPGDGMSDDIPGRIGLRQPARLADGEFVVPADVVSHLGNGSTDAGAKQLYAMMDKVRKARTGTKKQGREINPRKYVPA